MKKILTILLAFYCINTSFAQRRTLLNQTTHDERPIHFGFSLGLNVMDFIVRNNAPGTASDTMLADVSTPVPGFHIQIITNYRLAENLDARFLPGISFGQRTVNFFKKGKLVSEQQLESNYLEFPVLIKYKSKRLTNFRPYVVTGLNPRFDIAKTYNEDQGIYLDLNMFDLFYEIGAGIDFYLPYFKFSTELKFSYGLMDDLNRRNSKMPQYQNTIERLNSTMVLLSFHFE